MERKIVGTLVLLLAFLFIRPAQAEDFWIQGLSADTKAIQVGDLTVEEAVQMDGLTELELVDGLSARKLEGLAELARRRPDCRVLYQTRVGGEIWTSEDSCLRAENADYALLNALLPCFPRANRLHLAGQLPQLQELNRLRRDFPNLTIDWEVYQNGKRWPSDTKTLDFSGQTITAAQLRELLSCLPELETVDVRDTGISQENMMALCMEFPGVVFRWVMEAFDQTIPWDCTELNFSDIPMEDSKPVEDLLYCLPDLQKVEMCGCGIDNETMDALNRRHENTQVIWSFPYGKEQIRTDITWFLPFMYSVLGATNDETLANLRYCTELLAVDLGHTNVTDISWVRYTPKLRFLIVGDSPISDLSPLADVTSLVYLEAFQTNVTDYTPLLTCSGLEDLNIGYTYGDPAVIQQMTWLKNLWWHMPWTVHSDYEEDWEYMKVHIGELMPDTTASLLHSDSSTGRGWRDLPNYFAQRDTVHMVYMTG